MADHVQNWSTGQSTATPEQAQQALPEGMIERVAARAGVSPAVAQGAIAIALPMILAHVTGGGQQSPPAQGGLGSMASEILGKFL